MNIASIKITTKSNNTFKKPVFGVNNISQLISFKGQPLEKLNKDIFQPSFMGEKDDELLDFVNEKINDLKTKQQNAKQKNTPLVLVINTYTELLKDMFNNAEKFKNNSKKWESICKTYEFISLIYKSLGDDGKMKIEDTILDMMKISKDNYLIYLGTNFFFDDDEHKDKDFQKLTDIVKKLNNFDSQEGPEYIKTREELFKQEFLITFQEFMEPEKYLDRAVKMNVFHDGFPENCEEVLLKSRALTALNSIIITEGRFNINPDAKLCKALSDNILNNLSEMKNYDQNEELVIASFNVLCNIFKFINTENQNKIQDFAYKIQTQSNNKNIKEEASYLIKHTSQNNLSVSEEKLINEYNTGDKSTKISKLMLLTNINSPKAKDITTSLLTDNNADTELKRTAVWTAAYCKNSTNFKLLCDLVNPNKLVNLDKLTSDEIELKELALRSIAEYGDKKAVKLLKETIDSINATNKQKNKPEELKQLLLGMSELAEVLLDNINAKKSTREVITKIGYPQKVIDQNNYYQKDFYIKKHLNSLSNEHGYLREKSAYESLRNKFIPHFNTLAPDLQNYIDNILLPFRTLLKEVVSTNKKTYIIDDTVTSILKSDRGKRLYTNRYGESNGGVNTTEYIIIPFRSTLDSYVIASTMGHEWGHVIHDYIMEKRPELAKKIENLYNKALEQDGFLSYYSKTNKEEYFATANEAYLSIYKPHGYFATKDNYNDHFSNTRSRLRRIDPEMFKLLDELYKENSRINLT